MRNRATWCILLLAALLLGAQSALAQADTQAIFDEYVQSKRVKPTSVTITADENKILSGHYLRYDLWVLPENADPSVRWSSSNPSVARISQTGRVTALAAGKTRITARALYGGKSGSATLKVLLNERRRSQPLVWGDRDALTSARRVYIKNNRLCVTMFVYNNRPGWRLYKILDQYVYMDWDIDGFWEEDVYVGKIKAQRLDRTLRYGQYALVTFKGPYVDASELDIRAWDAYCQGYVQFLRSANVKSEETANGQSGAGEIRR